MSCYHSACYRSKESFARTQQSFPTSFLQAIKVYFLPDKLLVLDGSLEREDYCFR